MNLFEEAEPAAIPAVAKTLKTLVDGTVRLNIDVEPHYREVAMRLFGEPGVGIAVARLTVEASKQSLQAPTTAPYRQHAKALRLSSFFRAPEVWRAIGTDAQFLAWLRLQKCAFCSAPSNEHHPIEAAHVRRVAAGAGTAIKPHYCAIPLCHDHHALQHTKGEGALGGRDWFDKKRIEYVTQWAWEILKQQLGFESWAQVPPEILHRWATTHGVQNYLPPDYCFNSNS